MKKNTKRILTSLFTCLPLVSLSCALTKQDGSNLLASNELKPNLYDYSDFDNGEPPVEPLPMETKWLNKTTVDVSELNKDLKGLPLDQVTDDQILKVVYDHISIFYEGCPEDDNESKLNIKVTERKPLEGYLNVSLSIEFGYVNQELTQYDNPLGGTVKITGFKSVTPTDTKPQQIALPPEVDFQFDTVDIIRDELLKKVKATMSLPYNANPTIEVGKLTQASHVNTRLHLDHYYDQYGFSVGEIDIQIVALSTNPNKNLQTIPKIIQNGISITECKDNKSLATQSLNTISDTQLAELAIDNLDLFFNDMRQNLTATDYRVENFIRTALLGKVTFTVTIYKAYRHGLKVDETLTNTVTIYGFKSQAASQMEPRTLDLPPDLPIRPENLQKIKERVVQYARSLEWPEGANVSANDPAITNGSRLTFTISVSKYFDETGAAQQNGTFEITAVSTSPDRNANTTWKDVKTVNLLEGEDNNVLLETTTNDVSEIMLKSFIIRNINLLYNEAPTVISPTEVNVTKFVFSPIKGSIACQVQLSYTMVNGLPVRTQTLGGEVDFVGFKPQPPTNLENRTLDLPSDMKINDHTLSDIRAYVQDQIPSFDLHLPPDCVVSVQVPTKYSEASATFQVTLTRYYDAQGFLKLEKAEFYVTCISTDPNIGRTTEPTGTNTIDSKNSNGSNVLQGKTLNDINSNLARQFVFDNRAKLFNHLPSNVTKDNFVVSINRNLSSPKDGELVVNATLNKTLLNGNESNKSINISNLRITNIRKQLPTLFTTCVYTAHDVSNKYFSDIDSVNIENDAKQYLREQNHLPANITLERVNRQESREGAVYKFASPEFYNDLGWAQNERVLFYVSVVGFKENSKYPTAQEIIEADKRDSIVIIENKEDSKWWIWVIVGVSIFLVLMIIISILVTISRKRQEKKRKELLEQNMNHSAYKRVEYIPATTSTNKKIAPPKQVVVVNNGPNRKPMGAPVFKPGSGPNQPPQGVNHPPHGPNQGPHGPNHPIHGPNQVPNNRR